MAKRKIGALGAKGPWNGTGKTAKKNLDLVLGSVVNLPLRYWSERMLFFGAPDEELSRLSNGVFPAKLVAKKTHPVFVLDVLPFGSGARVCPCSSQRPYRQGAFSFIRKGCRLLHTGTIQDRDAYLIDWLHFPLPPKMAYRLRFKGQVPQDCIGKGQNEKGPVLSKAN